MTLPLIFCMVATVIPVFFSKISSAPTWLALQALALGWITITRFETFSLHASLVGLEVLLVRAVLVPHLLRRALRKQPDARISLMPSNLFAWIIAIMLIILAFKFGDGARADARALTLGVVAATVVIAFLILSTNHEPKAQLVALLFMENALALFETLMPEHWPLTVHLAMSSVYVLTVFVGSWLVGSDEQSHESAYPPLQGEGRGGDGVGAAALAAALPQKHPHPPPILPLEGGGDVAHGFAAIGQVGGNSRSSAGTAEELS